MEKRNEDEPISAIKKIKMKKLKIGNQINQQCDIIIPDTFGSDGKIILHEIYNMNNHELRDVSSIQKLNNQPVFFKDMIDLNKKLVETIRIFKDTLKIRLRIN